MPRYCDSRLMRGYADEALRPTNATIAPVSIYVTFLRCPRCAYLSFKGVRFRKTRASVTGIFHHIAFDYLMAKEFSLACMFNPSAETDVAEEFESELQIIKRNLELRFRAEFQSVGADYEVEWELLERSLRGAYAAWISRLRSFASATKLEGAELAKAFVPSRKFEVFISAPTLGFSGGKIDVLEDGIPIEIKTGDPPKEGLSLYHALQVTYYALMLEYRTGRDVDFGEIIYTRSNKRRMLTIDREKRLLALKVRDEAMETFQKKELPDSFCRWCLPLSRGEIVA
ncbi:MAG: Dna2/Cas4 domain-containing protein [Candidatus Bathyarchaeia archaeon]